MTTHLLAAALPVPPRGAALGPAGDAYVERLQVRVSVARREAVIVSGTVFEALMMALRYQHLAFHPRTRALLLGQIKTEPFAAAVAREWAALDTYAQELPELLALAETLQGRAQANPGEVLAWSQAN